MTFSIEPTIELFREAMNRIGVTPPDTILADGTLHRFHVAGDHTGSKNGWYILYTDDPPIGIFGCWKRGISEKWCSMEYETLTPEEKARYTTKMEAMRSQRDEYAEKLYTECRAWCEGTWSNAKDATNDHPYLTRKGVDAYGLKLFNNSLILPLRDTAGTIHGMQFIGRDGEKKFKTGTRKQGCYFFIGQPKGKILVCEGYATGASLHEATGEAVAVAFDAGNLKPVAEALRQKYPDNELIVCADDDYTTEGNPGLTKATEAALAVNGKLAVPSFPDSRGVKDTDFNDMACLVGNEAVSRCIESAQAPFDTDKAVHCDSKCHERHTETFDMSRLTLGSEIAAGNYEVSFVVDKLIPENAITLYYGKGGCGKSTLATQLGASIVEGKSFMGLSTTKRPVVIIDYENPLAVQKRRIEAVQDSGKIYFWTTCNDPPRIDENRWIELKSLIITLEKPVIMVDTLASSCPNSDIADNKNMALIMKRVVDLRNLGSTIILLHHSPKGDETKWIGATCIYSQVDHVLAMYPVKKPGSDAEATDDDEIKTYRFGTKDKSRYEHFAMYIVFNEDQGCFEEAEDPDNDIISLILQEIEKSQPINQSTLLGRLKSYCPEKKMKRILANGEGRLWVMEKGAHNAKLYSQKSSSAVFQPQGVNNCQTENLPQKTSSAVLLPLVSQNCQTEISGSGSGAKEKSGEPSQRDDSHGFGSFSEGDKKLEKQESRIMAGHQDEVFVSEDELRAGGYI